MPVENLPIFTYFNKQRFTQYGCMDLAGWYGVLAPDTKKEQALYPTMGRQHINYFGQNVLIFDQEPSQIFKTIDFVYLIVGTSVIRVDKFYNQTILGTITLGSTCWFDFFPVGDIVFGMLTTGTQIYVIQEIGGVSTMTLVTDSHAPPNPEFVAAFGNFFVVSEANTPTFYVSVINLGGNAFNANTCFTTNGASLTSRASGIIRQIGVLHNQMYIFCDFVTDIWSNIPTQAVLAGSPTTFPFKLNSSYNWDYGIADPFSLSIDFGRLVFLGQNASGLISLMASNGQQPIDISTQAISVLLQNSTNPPGELSPFNDPIIPVNGFLYQYENTVFYRVSAGTYMDYGEVDVTNTSYSLEYNFSTQKWNRVIELNGERNRIEKHIYYNKKHLVTVQGDPVVYEMAGNIYHNELRNVTQTNANAADAFNLFPMRYVLATQQIFQPDYSEFITDYVEIDFVFGDMDFYKFNGPFANTIFIIKEDAAPDGSPIFCIAENQILGQDIFLIMENGNTPSFADNIYYALFKPNIGLYYSDDGGVTYLSADLREFSQLGQYRWRMRWWELGTSRNRSYQLRCISSAPVVVLGAVQNVRRASGGAN